MTTMLGLVLWSGLAWGATLTGQWGTMAAVTSQAATADQVCGCEGSRAAVFLFDETAGGGATFTGNLQQSIDNGTTWTDVSGSGTSTDGTLVAVNAPVGCYRFELSACSSCSVTVKYRCAAD